MLSSMTMWLLASPLSWLLMDPAPCQPCSRKGFIKRDVTHAKSNFTSCQPALPLSCALASSQKTPVLALGIDFADK